jgi:hypothetical protein
MLLLLDCISSDELLVVEHDKCIILVFGMYRGFVLYRDPCFHGSVALLDLITVQDPCFVLVYVHVSM